MLISCIFRSNVGRSIRLGWVVSRTSGLWVFIGCELDKVPIVISVVSYSRMFIDKYYSQKAMTDQFRDAMDLLDNYDRSVTEVAHSLNEAMLELAHLKFTDPYTSVSTAGFRPTPAVRGVEEQEGRLVATWHKPEFNNPSFEEEYELQEQQI